MSKLIFLLFLFVGPAELRSRVRLPAPPSPEEAHLGRGEDASEVPGASRDVAPRRGKDPSWYFTTPRVTSTSALRPNSSTSSSSSSGPPPPPPLLFAVADGSYWAYALMLLALSLFSVGMVGNLALMCTVWHNAYLQSAWNCILAGLAFLDFLVLFFCLPVVVFHELTFRRLLGGASCRLVPYLEVTSLGVATFSLCALSIDRFHAATSPTPGPAPRLESCRSILSKMAVIWLGSLALATPEVLLWQLRREPVGPPELVWWREAVGPGGGVDMCLREPSAELPVGVYSLVLTYQEARTWWMIGCYVCLPLLFTLACDLVTQRVSAHQPVKAASRRSSSSASSCVSSSLMKKKRHHHHHHHHHHHQHQHQHAHEPKLRSTVMWLTALYVACNIPDSACNIALAYVEAPATVVAAASGLAGHFFLFARCAATPVLLLCLCRSLGQAFLDCCCCCCDECLPDVSSSASTATSALSSPSPTSSMPPDDASQAIGTPC
ncbi:G-protein coupled receptor 37-like 1 [Hippocampus zosterae]|uniref:G-protein coupled receptor 37-like 1 n=1 Tax=Hippocampus zosterae TaxID=109293 RepID=UPI00223DBF99|nr:G-protein coupled receptor 37-like 1 [Hippocampus zosterae]